MRGIIILSFLFIQSIGAEKENAEARKLYEQSVQTKDTDEKAELRNQIAEKYPETSYGYFSRGSQEELQKNFETAVELYTKAIKLNPKLYMAYGNRGKIYLSEFENYPSALKDFEAMIKLEPKNSDGYVRKCTVQIEQKKYSDALKTCDAAVNLGKNNPLAYFMRGSANALLNKLKPAYSDADKAIELNDSFLPAYCLRGRISILMENKKKACEDFQLALILGSEEGNALYLSYCTRE